MSELTWSQFAGPAPYYVSSAPVLAPRPYEFRGDGRSAIVEPQDGMFRVRCSDIELRAETWRSSDDEAYYAAYGWAFEGVLPQSQPTLRGLAPVSDEQAPGLQRVQLMRGAHGDVTVGEAVRRG